jgi:hypothetical protein
LDSISLNYTGPWWRDPYCHGGSCDSGFPHGYSADGQPWQEESDKKQIANAVSKAIRASDLLFAWIDSHDCYGTLLEIGYARGLGKTVVAVFSDTIDARELWLAQAAATYSLTAKTPRDGWDEFWRLVAFEQMPPAGAVSIQEPQIADSVIVRRLKRCYGSRR